MFGNIVERIERLPVGFLATTVGLATLSNAYSLIGFAYIKFLCMIIALTVFLMGTLKLTKYNTTFLAEYKNVVPASLYGAYSMLAMISGAFLFNFNKPLGEGLWLFGVVFHASAIVIFTYRNVFKNFKIETFVPSWFVTYNGIMVSVVVGGAIKAPILKQVVLIYGLFIFFLIIPFMIKRLITNPLPDMLYHTKAVLLAPSSLCVVSYFNIVKQPNFFVACFLYGIVFITLLSILKSIPKFFSFNFHPGFAGTTFPMAIGTIASFKMAGYLLSINQPLYAQIIKNIAGLQVFITTAIIGMVFFNFLKQSVVKKDKI